MVNQKRFNLQLFGDDTAADYTDAETTPDSVGEESSSGQPDAEYGLIVDAATGRRTIVPIEQSEESAPETGEPPEAQAPESAATQSPEVPAPYTAEELMRAITLNRVDENRIPGELAGEYAAIRAQNQLAYQEALLANQASPKEPQSQEKPPQEDMLQSYIQANERISAIAEEQALAAMGLTKEKIEELKYNDDDESQNKVKQFSQACEIHKQAIRDYIAVQNAELQRQREETLYALEQAKPIINEYKKDPAYPEIDRMMNDHYKQLPYHQAAKIAATIQRVGSGLFTQADMQVLDEYYKLTREAYYAKKAGVGRTPQKVDAPTVERPGSGEKAGAEDVDFSKMRTMSKRERDQFLMNVLKGE